MTDPDGPMYDEDEQPSVDEQRLVSQLQEQERKLQRKWDQGNSAAPGSVKRFTNTREVMLAASVLEAVAHHVDGYRLGLDFSRPEDDEDEDDGDE